jgi:hypothetical protein
MDLKVKISGIEMKIIVCAALLIMQNLLAADCLPKRNIKNFRTFTGTMDGVKMHIHYPLDKESFARRTYAILTEEVSKIHAFFQARPRTDVHWIVDQAIDSNGMATVFPYNIVNLLDFPPTADNYLAKTSDWVKNLVIHEYVHIVTMDMTDGWIDSLRAVFGSAVKTNGIIPRWMTEGVAVWYESQEKGQGRLSQPQVKWQIVEALKDENFCQELGCLDEPMTYPYGHAPYWIGGAFVEYLEEQRPGFLRCFYHTHAKYIPFFMNRVFHHCGLTSVEQMYQQFKEHYLRKYQSLPITCPWANQRCDYLVQNKLNKSLVDYEVGSCLVDNHLYFVTREEKGRTRLSQAFKIIALDLHSGDQKVLSPRYPVEHLQDGHGRCLVKERADVLCKQEAHFYELKNDKIDFIKTSSALAMEYNQQEDRWQDKFYMSSHQPQDEAVLASDYPASKYLSPEYFLFDYSNFANLSAINLNTVLVDPLKKHSLALSLTSYFPENNSTLIGESLNYRLSSDNWGWSLYYSKFYFTNTVNQEIAESQQVGSAWQKVYSYQDWKMHGVMRGNHYLGDDFISKREITSLQLQHQMQKIQNSQESALKNLSLGLGVGQFWATTKNSEKNYLSFESNFFHSYFLGATSEIGQRIQFGKYFKDDLRSGYLAAGGVNNFFANGYAYPLYSVAYLDLLGNEITTTNIFWSGPISQHYQGWGLLPVFLKDTRLEIGAEYAKSYVYLTADQLYYNDYVAGLYAKYTLNLKLAYIWDASLSLAFAQTQHPAWNNRFLILFDAVAF